MHRRIQNLDLIRAIAISLVLIFHTVQMVPDHNKLLFNFARSGEYGVDLFFVLSGFLIGGLYWRERQEFGSVEISRFIFRRVLRTIPPYFVMLIPAYLAVYFSRGEPFDYKYLFFLQNYNDIIPFFLVSWSLCVEEHFYLFLPFLLGVICLKGRNIPFLLAIIAVLPLFVRLMAYSDIEGKQFGYYFTATHLRYEGLVLGVLAAYIVSYKHQWARKLVPARYVIYLIATMFLVFTSWIPENFMYVAGYSALAVLFTLVILVIYEDTQYRFSASKPIFILANSSYSIYLTHALVIHVVLIVSARLMVTNPFIVWLFMVISVLMVGYLFYLMIEKSSLRLRDRLVGKRVNKAFSPQVLLNVEPSP